MVSRIARLDLGGFLCLEEHSKSKLAHTASINQIKKRLLAILFCMLKNNASGYPTTGTAIEIFDTMYFFMICLSRFAVFVSQLFSVRDEMEYNNPVNYANLHCPVTEYLGTGTLTLRLD